MTEQLNDDLRLLEDTVTRFAQANAAPAGMAPTAPDLWPMLAEMGLIGLSLSPESGGAGFGATGALIAARALGRQAVPAGLAIDAVLVPALLDAAGATELRDEAIAGTTRFACHGALLTGAGGTDLAFGPEAPDFVLLATADDLTLAAASECIATNQRMIDGRPLYRLKPCATGRKLPPVAREAVLSLSIVAAAGEALGAVEALCALTLDHLATRRQFGKPLGAFQALQFRMVDVDIAREELRALATAAARALDANAPRAALQAHAAWIQAVWTGRQAAAEAIQMFGGMGMTADCAIAPLVKRLTIAELMFGGDREHLKRYRTLAA